jgi:soluble lytic murein transglycosylase
MSPRATSAQVHTRRAVAVILLLLVGAVVLLVQFGGVDKAIKEVTLPLRHDDIIRQESRQHGVDAALIAAVINVESGFRDQTSHADARGLMQITPDTAHDIERLSGGTTFELEDLSDPDINIAYGTFYLRQLLDDYEGSEVAALAAYNAGPGNVDEWGGSALEVDDIEFPETAAYVEDVLEKRESYREKYARELGY